MLRGDLQDMSADPLAAARSLIHLANNPSKSPTDARVTVVEYSDFQCPSCRQLHQTLRTIVPAYPQVRFVFKDFPLVQIHPWAMTAAIAGRCAYQESPEAFWKLHDTVFDNQDAISPDSAWQKRTLLEQYIQYELSPQPSAAPSAPPPTVVYII